MMAFGIGTGNGMTTRLAIEIGIAMGIGIESATGIGSTTGIGIGFATGIVIVIGSATVIRSAIGTPTGPVAGKANATGLAARRPVVRPTGPNTAAS
jgi:hypothetical protein